MKVLVTGSSGFLGSALVERLLANGHNDIRCFVRPSSNRARLEAIAERYPDAQLEFATGNITSADDVEEAIKGCKVVFHLAAAMAGGAADMFLNTVVGSKNVLEAVTRRKTVKVVLVSSMGVYGVADQPGGYIVTENTPLDPHPEQRDVYSYSKWRQEKLFEEYRAKSDFPLVILRPGVIYGRGGAAMSSRVGVNVFGIFLHLGRSNMLPLTHVVNTAEACVVAGMHADAVGQVYNVVDDDIPTCREFLKHYRRIVKRVPYVTLPYFFTRWMSGVVARYHKFSRGQLPAIFTPYKSAAIWKGNRFDNSKLKALGWRQLVSTRDGLSESLQYHREQIGV